MIFRRPRRAISGPCYLGERFEQFVLLGLGDGAEVEHEVVADDARDDGRRVMTEARVEGVGRERGVREGDERGRGVRGRRGAAADGRLAVDEGAVERVRAETRAEAFGE